ncbi:MAG: hypothetical protein ACKO8I_01805 [Cyanobacteriota bacterium]
MPNPTNHWIYALPGTHLGGLRSAGAPALDALASLTGDHRDPLADEESALWRGWILYGPPDQALAELCRVSDQQPQGEALATWRDQLTVAAQVKRRWRDQVTLVHLDDVNASGDPSFAMAYLKRELPELELEARLQRPAGGQLPDELTRMAALSLMQGDPGLLQAYLDLENWADHPSPPGQRALWRTAPSHALILTALATASVRGQAVGRDQRRINELTADLRRLRDEQLLLHHTVQQLEAELEHYVSEHLALNAIASQVEDQLLRARRLFLP